MAETKKNKGGRPKRAAGEKLERVTLNLRPSIMFGLELLARERRTSLSQAAEFALAVVLRSHKIEGENALDLANEATSLLVSHLNEDGGTVGELLDYELDSRVWRISYFPRNLRTPEEQYLLDVADELEKLGVNVWDPAAKKLGPPGILDLIAEGYRLGVSTEDHAKALKKQHGSAIKLGAFSNPKPFKKGARKPRVARIIPET